MHSAHQQELIERLQRKDKSVVAELYDKYSSTLYGIILRIVPQEEIAQDVLQDAFIKIWNKGSAYDESKGTLFTWMLNICRNTAIDKTRSAAYKKQKKIQEIDSSVYNHKEWSYQPKPEHIGLEEEVLKLENKYREIIELIYFQGFTQKEVTEHLNIPLGTVKSRVRIGLRELRKIFSTDKVEMILIIHLFYEQLAPILHFIL